MSDIIPNDLIVALTASATADSCNSTTASSATVISFTKNDSVGKVELSANSIDKTAVVSKRFLKRMAKKEEWEKRKLVKRKLQKEKRKELGLPNRTKGGGKRRRRFKKMSDSSCQMHIVVDLSFDELMIEKDVLRCANQINRCYSVNRSMPNPLQFHVTSFEGQSKVAVSKQIGFENWDVVFHEEPYDKVFEKEKLVYLTSESRNVLTELDDKKIYVIGGIVDHNSRKGLCHLLAEEKGIQHGRLPLQEWVDMKTRSVLSINQVFCILSNVAQGKSWKDAILLSIPPRKNAKAKDETEQLE